MKKIGQSARTPRAAEAARARRAARTAKRRPGGTVARTAVAAAIGAGVLLHGGHDLRAAGTPGAVEHVAMTVALDDSGTPDGDGGSEGESSTDSGSKDGGSEEPGSKDGGSEDAGTKDAGSTDTGATDTGANGPETAAPGERTDGGESDADPAGSGSPGKDASTDETVAATATPATTGSTSRPASSTTATSPSAAMAAEGPVRPAARVDAAIRATPTDPSTERGRSATRDAAAITGAAAARATEAIGTAQSALAAPTARATEAIGQNVLTRLALALVGVSPTATGGGPTPVTPSSALLLAQWAVFRRSENPLLNRSPEITDTAGAQPTAGRIVATDPDGDRLRYQVSRQPANGTVTIDPSTGAYVYTPNPGFTGTDSFQVTVRDNDLSAPGLGRYTDLVRQALAVRHPALAQRLFGAHTDTSTIAVVIGPTAQPPTAGPTIEFADPVESITPTRGGVVYVRSGGVLYRVDSAGGERSAVLSGASTPDLNADGTRMLVLQEVDGETRVVLLDTADGRTLASVPVPADAASAPTAGLVRLATTSGSVESTFTPDGRRVLVRDTASGSLTLLDAADGTVLGTATVPGYEQFRFAPNGSRAYVYDAAAGAVTVVDLADGSTSTIPVGGGAYTTLEQSDDGRRVTVLNADDRTVTIIDTNTGTAVTTGAFSSDPGRVDVGPDGSKVYVTLPGERIVAVVDADTGGRVGAFAVGADPAGLAFSPDGTRGYVVNYEDATMTVFDPATDTVRTTVPTTGQWPSLKFGENRLFVVSYLGPTTVVDTVSDEVVTVAPTAGYTYDLNPDGTKLYASGYDGSFVIVDENGGWSTVTLTGDARGTSFSADGSRAYVQDDTGLVVIDGRTDRVRTTISGRYDQTVATPDGDFVATIGRSGDGASTEVVFIDVATDTIVTRIPAENAYEITFSADGRYAYVVGSDVDGGTVTVIDLDGDVPVAASNPALAA